MTKWLWIAAGGAVGSVLRYSMQGWVQRLSGTSFPLGTLAVNVLGCLAVGFMAALATGMLTTSTWALREEYRLGLMVGLLGGFTTFSAFGLETFNLAGAGQLWLAGVNVVLSCGLGLFAVWIGVRLAEYWFGV